MHTALTSLLKDTKNVKRQDFLLHHDLDDTAGARELYLQARSEWLEFFALLQILDPLIDYAAARNGVPWASQPAGIWVEDGAGWIWSRNQPKLASLAGSLQSRRLESGQGWAPVCGRRTRDVFA